MHDRWESGVTARATELQALRATLQDAYESRDDSALSYDRWREAAGAFHLAVRDFYAPYEEVLVGVRAGREEAIEEATKFLVADPWCFRSGYVKAELMHALANASLPSQVLHPLRQVVLHRITHRHPRLLRYAAQLAANLWDEQFEADIVRLATHGSAEERIAAERVLVGARQRMRSLA